MIYSTYTVGGILCHARAHKYINKFRGKNGKWRYIYNLSKAAAKDGAKFLEADTNLTTSHLNNIANKAYSKAFRRYSKAMDENANYHKNEYMKTNKHMGLYSGYFDDLVYPGYGKDKLEEDENTYKEYKNASRMSKGAEKESRNEAKLNRRENERARRDAATNARVDNYGLALNAAAKYKQLDRILKRAYKSAQKKAAKKK